MKKFLALLLAAMMLLSLAACGGNEYDAAAKEIEEITGEKTTAADVKEAIKELEELSGEKMTAEEFVEFTRSMYALASGDWDEYEPEDEAWPFADIPEWPVAEGLTWEDYYGENQIDVFAKGSEDDINAWVEDLRGAGFKGYYWGGDELEFYIDDYWIYLDDRGTGDGEFHLVIRSGDMELGFPDEIEDLFPAYNGDGALVYGGMEEYDGEKYYFFQAVGETEEGGKRYLQALKDMGFESESDSPYSGAGGYYYKTQGGKRIGYASEEYWYMFDDATGTGQADFSLTVE